MDIAPNDRGKLERLCRAVSRPPVASERLALTASGQVRYTLKTPYQDGTTPIVLEPLNLMARLAVTRYHGVLAPHSQYRAALTPAHRGRDAARPPVSSADATEGARTWAPKGEIPVLQYNFSWNQRSVIAGLSYWRFYLPLFNGSINSPQIVEFFKALQATIGKKLLIIWDRLEAHRSKLVRARGDAHHGQIMIDYLPSLRTEYEPGQMHLGVLKHHAIPNFCDRDLGDVAHRARSNLRSMQRRTTLVQAFWKQVDLF